jgi:hypothetical protein
MSVERAVLANLIRPPATPGEVAADAVRVLGLLSFVGASVFVGGTAFPLFALIVLGQLLPRFLGLRPALDIAIGVVLLVAGWSNPLELYRMIEHWDVVMHFSANGLIAVVAYLLVVRLASRSGPTLDPSAAVTIVVTTALGMAASVVWEIGEWFGHTFIDGAIVVEYADTIGDLAAGGLGSLVAGFIVASRAIYIGRVTSEQSTTRVPIR